MFRKILIANRGEIACRIVMIARRLGIASVAVYSDADRAARHLALADEAWPIGPALARDSYLSIPKIVEAAQRSGAEAVHPGYGFLSENAAFAEACAAAGLVFVGPPPAAIRAMGSKAAAKTLMERAGVPIVPGYHGEAQDPATLLAAAERIGWPVLLKASAGGGGKGMRAVERPADFAAALDGVRREALASFGDDRVLVERYLTRPRHIEIQVFADTQGTCLSLFERDCSIQRRHQKIIEEAPAPGLDAAHRRRMGEAAVAATAAVGYVGAGTVEFIAEGDAFYFLEMNTRLQVEHPVTEAITGLDLVEWQLRVAAGEPLPCAADAVVLDGHAIEARVYAEDPARDFLPSIGRIVHLRQPAESAAVRVDTGVRAGDVITPFYDPMIAKLIVHGRDRADAVRRLQAALAEYEVVGVETNLALLGAVAAHPAFAAGDIDTGFLARHPEIAAAAGAPLDADRQRAACCAAALARFDVLCRARAASAGDPWSPWNAADAWRLNGAGFLDVTLAFGGDAGRALRLYPLGDGACRIVLPDGEVTARLDPPSPAGVDGVLTIDGVRRRARVVERGADLVVIVAGRNVTFTPIDPLAPARAENAGDDRLTAPIPARVTRVLVAPGDRVARGAPLVVLEAMKTELTLAAPFEGTVEAVHCAVDDMVEEGAELIALAAGGS
jgi:3-methylcrotonyl-CoA carboxylase alpha subunit